MKIGVIGCGAIGSVLCTFIDKELTDTLYGVCDIDDAKARAVAASIKSQPKVMELEKLIRKCDLVVEAVNPGIVRTVLKKCIRYKTQLMVMSVGGVVTSRDLLSKLTARLFIPSGAVCGIDGIKAASIGKIESVRITTTKHPAGLVGAPYIVKKRINVDKIKGKEKIFDGTALDAINGFPKNINVSAILSLAGVGEFDTRVTIIADPKAKRNKHEVEVVGSFGRIKTISENVVSPLNPKTSHLAVLSACATLKRLSGLVKIGT